ncbi:MAG: hypothetical protein AB7N65_02935 [Vicinamibacterales bacterium]
MNVLQRTVGLAVAVLATTVVLQGQGAVSGVFFSEGWESGSAAGSFNSAGFGNAAGLNTQFFLQNGNAGSGSWSLQHRLTAGQDPDSVAYATQHFGDAISGPVWPTGAGQHFFDIYVQYKIYYSPGFQFDAHGLKMLELGTQDNYNQTGVCCNPWVANYTTLYVTANGAPALEGNNKGAATPEWIGYPQNASGYTGSNPLRLQPGRWHTIEVRRRLNDAGADNGILQLWVDGVLVVDYRNARIRAPRVGAYGANYAYGTNWVMISDYPHFAVPQSQSVSYDDVKISTTPIGSGVAIAPPRPPTNVRLVR